MFTRTGLQAERVDVALGELESFLDPFLGISFLMPDVTLNRVLCGDLGRELRDVLIARIGSGRVVPKGMKVAARRHKHTIAAGVAFGRRLQKAADAMQRLMHVA